MRYPLILFCLALSISILFSADKLNSFREIYKYAGGLAVFIIVISLSPKNRKYIIATLILSALVISILAIRQYFFGFKYLMNYVNEQKITNPFVLDYIARRRVYFPFVTPNTLAGYLAFIIPLTLLVKNKAKWAIFLVLLSALLLTKSLGALASLFLGMFFYLLLRKDLPAKKFALLTGIGMIFIIVFLLRQASVKEHTLPVFSLGMRLEYWKDTLQIIQQYYLTGIGPGNFNLAMSRYAHNSYLQLWAEMGILGLISFLWLIIAVFKAGIQSLKYSTERNQIACLISANAVFLMHNFVDFTFFLPEVSLIWWVVLGLLTHPPSFFYFFLSK